MAFEVIARATGGKGRRAAAVRVSVRNNGSGHQLVIAFSAHALEQLGFQPAADEAARIEVSRGSGPDAGWLRLRASPRGYKLSPVTSGASDMRLMLAAWAGVPRTFPVTAPELRPDAANRCLLIKLPFPVGAA